MGRLIEIQPAPGWPAPPDRRGYRRPGACPEDHQHGYYYDFVSGDAGPRPNVHASAYRRRR
jgi:hypothetical protein